MACAHTVLKHVVNPEFGGEENSTTYQCLSCRELFKRVELPPISTVVNITEPDVP